jgi:hypothetical protein
VSRRALHKTSRSEELSREAWRNLVDGLHGLAERFGLRFGRRARLRLVHPEQEFKPAPSDLQMIRPARLDARGLQRMLEAELWRNPAPHDGERHAPREPVRRSG